MKFLYAAVLPFALIPLPKSAVPGRGSFAVTPTTVIAADNALKLLGRQLSSMLAPATGFDLPVKTGGASGGSSIALRRQPSLERTLGPEGYRLEVKPKGITISAATEAGVFYGIQTLRQLLPPEIFREARVNNVVWNVPAVSIEDTPRFSWRGAHLDTARHFMPKEFVKKYIDLMAIHKLNRFHWHLTDDQGWRLEIRKYPKLTEVGAWRKETIVGRQTSDLSNAAFDGKRYGGFYSQDDVREIVAYAAERFITVIPEIEMPGHSQEVVAAYPEHGSTDQPTETRTHWGISPFLLKPDDATVRFMQDILTEVLDLFPGPWIHVGGDEANKTQWKASPEIQARIRDLGLKDENELQSWFIRQMDSFLTSHQRRLIGWDEILEGGLAQNATVMSWRGVDGAVAAARAGHDAVLTPTSNTYFDYYQARPNTNEPLAIGGFLPLDRVYTWEPMPQALLPAEQKHILGVQGQIWTEYIENPKAVEYMAFPRLTALAEVAWTSTSQRDIDEFRSRLATHVLRLRILDVNFRPLD